MPAAKVASANGAPPKVVVREVPTEKSSRIFPAFALLGLIAAVVVGSLRRIAPETLIFGHIKRLLVSQDPTVTLYMNGEHEGGKTITLPQDKYGSIADLGTHLSAIVGCRRVIDVADRDPNEPCKVFNSVGQRVKTLHDVNNGEMLFLVPPDRLFVWPTVKIGRKVEVDHIANGIGKKVIVETLSLSPRVFLLSNFMDMQEAETITHEAISIQDEEFKLKRSSTGTTGKTIHKTRTSENAFITASKTAMALKRRIFSLLGIEEFRDTWADGLQVLRYNVSQAYIDHLDYLDSVPGVGHSFASEKLGTNRFATVVLYFNDVEAGGETVFTRAAADEESAAKIDAVAQLRNSSVGQLVSAAGIEAGSWEETLAAKCASRLAIKPKKGTAVLFYNQQPDGSVDNASRHGACPVLVGQKWAANLWVWNGPRYGYTEVDQYGRVVEKQGFSASGPIKVSLTARNEDVEGAELYFNDQRWGAWAPKQDYKINTFVSHKWNARVGGQIVKTWSITEPEAVQQIVLSRSDLDVELETIDAGAADDAGIAEADSTSGDNASAETA